MRRFKYLVNYKYRAYGGVLGIGSMYVPSYKKLRSFKAIECLAKLALEENKHITEVIILNYKLLREGGR